MHQSAISAAVLLALAPSALAVGTAHVINNCAFPVYYASVAQSAHADMQQLQGSYSESYSKPGVGVSIKLADSPSGSVSQFEFTWGDGKIFYDLSNIDGSPFAKAGMSLVPSMMDDSANPTCLEVVCPAGKEVCDGAYNHPDDLRTAVCSDQSDLTLTLCPGGSGSSSPQTPTASSSASPSSAAATSAAPSATGYNTVRHLVAPAYAGGRFHPRHLPRK